MCTLEKHGNIYLLTLTGSDDHRFNPSRLSSLRAALSSLLSSSPPPNSALVTCAQGKFFSNGFDQSWVRSAPPSQHHILPDLLRGIITDLLSLPMPTVCAVTGHAAAGGCALVLAHDYVVMRGDRGFFYMSELDVGLKFVKYFEVLFNEKIPDSHTRRDVLLRSARLTGREAVARGIVDREAQGMGIALPDWLFAIDRQNWASSYSKFGVNFLSSKLHSCRICLVTGTKKMTNRKPDKKCLIGHVMKQWYPISSEMCMVCFILCLELPD